MEQDQNEIINVGVVADATSVPTAISMQVNAHSTGLMYEQSVLHQQRDFQLTISNSVMGFKKLAEKKLKFKVAKALKKSRFDTLK